MKFDTEIIVVELPYITTLTTKEQVLFLYFQLTLIKHEMANLYTSSRGITLDEKL
jgi:hypothetical protein